MLCHAMVMLLYLMQAGKFFDGWEGDNLARQSLVFIEYTESYRNSPER